MASLRQDIAYQIYDKEYDQLDDEDKKKVDVVASAKGFIYTADIDSDGNPDYFTMDRLLTTFGGVDISQIETNRDGQPDYSVDLRLVPEGLGRPLTEEEKKALEAKRKAAARPPRRPTAGEIEDQNLGEWVGTMTDAVLTGDASVVSAHMDAPYTGKDATLGGRFAEKKELKGRALLDSIDRLDSRGSRVGTTNAEGQVEALTPIDIDYNWTKVRPIFIQNLRDYWRTEEAKKKDPTFADFEEVHNRFNQLQDWTNKLINDVGIFGTKEDTAVAIGWFAEIFGVSDVDNMKDYLRELENKGTDVLTARIATAIAGTQITEGEIKHILSPIAGKGAGETSKFLVRMQMLDVLANRRLERGRRRETKNALSAELSDNISYVAANNMAAFKEHIAQANNLPTERQHTPPANQLRSRTVQRLGMIVNSAGLSEAANNRYLSVYGFKDTGATDLFEANLFAVATGSTREEEAGANVANYVSYLQKFILDEGTDFNGFTYTKDDLGRDVQLINNNRYKPNSSEVDGAINRLTYAYEIARQAGAPVVPTQEPEEVPGQRTAKPIPIVAPPNK